jgi:hypothetical protein
MVHIFQAGDIFNESNGLSQDGAGAKIKVL